MYSLGFWFCVTFSRLIMGLSQRWYPSCVQKSLLRLIWYTIVARLFCLCFFMSLQIYWLNCAGLILAILGVGKIWGQVPTCGSVHSWQYNSISAQGMQAMSTMTWYQTQSQNHYSDRSRPFTILFQQISKRRVPIVSVDWAPNSGFSPRVPQALSFQSPLWQLYYFGSLPLFSGEESYLETCILWC